MKSLKAFIKKLEECGLLTEADIMTDEIGGISDNSKHLKPGDLSGMNIPTLVIAGTNDMIRTSHTKKIHEAIPGSRLALIDGDHFVANKNPSAFNAAVMDFLIEYKENTDEYRNHSARI